MQSIESPDVAEGVRKELFNRLRIGDDPVNTRPEDEGQNGFTCMSLMCSRLSIPMVTLVVMPGQKLQEINLPFPDADKVTVDPPRAPADHEPAFLGVRVHRSYWKPPLTFEWGGEGSKRTFRLQGAALGSEFCDHQTALARSSEDVFHYFDSDAVRLGIGPLCFRTDDDSWWAALDTVLQYSNNTAESKFCDFSPHNRSPLKAALDHLHASGDPMHVSAEDADGRQHRLVNVDWLYTSVDE